VAAELTLETDETNQRIVDRARAALQILKGCASEQQRRDYRVVLIALRGRLAELPPPYARTQQELQKVAGAPKK
jgi:hypothetical protein